MLTMGSVCAARGFDITYETPRSEKLGLFHLGERKYDHLVFFPTKVKGTHASSSSNGETGRN